MMLHGVIPIVLVALVLPIGLVAGVLALEGGGVKGALDHGELFLAAGNAAFTGCLVLASARLDQPVNALIAATVVFIVLVLPAYGFWGVLTALDVLDKTYSRYLAIIGGGIFAGVAMVVSLCFVRLSYRPVTS
jgi:hypothetical protein